MDRKVYIALPVMDEFENLPKLMNAISSQTYKNIELLVCINQPDHWWDEPIKKYIAENNRLSIELLQGEKRFPVRLIDRSSPGKGWKGKKHGVGWARKLLMDSILEKAEENDVIVSMDADTHYPSEYVESLVENFDLNPNAVGLAAPYYHKLTNDTGKDRAILRYEIFMRHYAINLWRINNPYSFTAIGSAIALPAWAYRSVGGITPHKSGEDFYLLQKLRKFGKLILWNRVTVYPEARYSERVGFGTGPAMIRGRQGDWKSYPVYPYRLFDEIRETYSLFEKLFNNSVPTPMDEFILSKFEEKDPWLLLRQNFKTKDHFVRACTQKIDAFRILQYLKWRFTNEIYNPERHLFDFLEVFYPKELKQSGIDKAKFSFKNSSVKILNGLRNILQSIEENHQKKTV